MPLDFASNQGEWLDNEVTDRFVNGGICHAISVDWSAKHVLGQVFQLDIARFRAVSGQRAYKYSFEHRLQGLWTHTHFIAWLAQARTPTENFARSCLRGQAVHLAILRGQSLLQLENIMMALPVGHSIVMVLWGSNPQWPGSHNWGHSIAFTHIAAGFRYFDANQGQFSWPNATPAHTVAQEVSENIHNKYSPWRFRYIDIYTFS